MYVLLIVSRDTDNILSVSAVPAGRYCLSTQLLSTLDAWRSYDQRSCTMHKLTS